jgi:hypothetical protein
MAMNQGNYTENFNVTLFFSGPTPLSLTQALNLMNGTSGSVTFKWNTTGFEYGNYTIIAFVTLASGESNAAKYTGKYSLSGGTVIVAIPGDINGDGKVDSSDFHLLAVNWLENVPPAAANADIGGYGSVGPPDFHILATHWLDYLKNGVLVPPPS